MSRSETLLPALFCCHGSGQVCLISGDNQSRLPDMGAGEAQHPCDGWLTYSSSLRGLSSLALILSAGTRFIAWRLRRHFRGKCRWGPMNFWEWQAFLGYGLVPRPTLKRPRAAFVRGGTYDKYRLHHQQRNKTSPLFKKNGESWVCILWRNMLTLLFFLCHVTAFGKKLD